LQGRGITFGSSYVVESFAVVDRKASGSGAAYLASYLPDVTVDLSKLGVGRGEFFVGAQFLRSRSHDGIARQAVSNLEAPSFGGLREAWYADSYLGGRVRLKAGWQYADSEFGGVEAAAPFLNGSYGAIPTTPMPAYPEAAVGISGRFDAADWISFAAGVFRGPKAELGGTARTAPFVVVEARARPFTTGAARRTECSLGVWQQSGLVAGTAAGTPAARPLPNHGMYVTVEHSLDRDGSLDAPGPAVFMQWGWAPADRNEVAGYVGGGVVQRGIGRGRPRDVAGIGIASAGFASGRRETVVELFYQVRLAGALVLQPDLQWIENPGGSGGRALATGLRVSLGF
jgi:porin